LALCRCTSGGSERRSLFAIRECRMDVMVLKPQDVYVGLKIVACRSGRPPYSQLAAELVMSPSEVHASVQRAQSSHLLHGPRLKNRPNFGALEEFLLHGLKYVSPPERGELTRGVATSYAAAPLRRMIAQGSEPIPVWPYEEASNAVSRLSHCTKPSPSLPCGTRPFTRTWPLPTPYGIVASGTEKLPRKNCAAGSGRPVSELVDAYRSGPRQIGSSRMRWRAGSTVTRAPALR
jgi:hypothetical protein